MYVDGRDYDLTLERQVLAMVMGSGHAGALGQVLASVPVEDWYAPDHGRAVQWLSEWVRRGRPLDLVDITVELCRPVAEPGKAWRAQLGRALAVVSPPPLAALPHYLGQLSAMAQRRRLLAALAGAQQGLASCELDEVGSRCTEALERVRGATASRREHGAGYGWDDWLSDLQTASVEGARRRCGFGLVALDYMAAGNPGDLVVVAARPAVGKTALALQAAHTCALEGLRVGVASYEMSARQLMTRMAAPVARVDARTITDAPSRLTADEWDRLLEARERLGELPLHLLEAGHMTAHDLDRWTVDMELDLLIVDYLTIVPPMDRTASRERQVGETSTRLKQTAIERDCVVMLLAQLNRASVGQTVRAPVLSDLRDSGQIEQDADRVVMGWMPDEERTDRQWMVRKNRHGPVGVVDTSFDGKRQRFGLGDDDVEI